LNRHAYAYLIDRLLASDPALDRFKSGLRAVLTAGLCAGLFLLLTRRFGVEYKLALAGIVVPMVAVVALRDPGRGRQQATMAWVPVVAGTALVAGSFIAGDPWLGGACFVLTIFGAFQARRLGPRGAGLGTLAYQSFFYAMLFKNPPDEVAWVVLFVFVGCAIGYAVHFWIVPERPGRALPGELRAFRARIRALLHDLARRLEGDGQAADRRVDAHLAALAAQSLALDGRLAGFGGSRHEAMDLRAQVLHADMAAETVAAVARTVDDAGTRQHLAAWLRTLRDGLDLDGPAAAPPALPDPARWRLHRAADTLAGLPAWRQRLPALHDDSRPAPAADASAARVRHATPWFDDTTRRALQASAAALGALLAGRAISPSHWYWAVFAAFVVFTRTATVGQTLSGAWRQVLAAGAGLCVGVAFAELVHGNRNLELGLLFVFVALGFYAFRGMQNVYTVLLTAMLAMLYELLGMDSAGMLVVRLEDTVAGAVVAVLAARFVLPVHTRDESRAKSAELLRAAGGLLGDALADPPRPAPHDAVRTLDRSLQAVRASLGPVTVAAYPGAKSRRRRHLDRLARIVYCIRHACVLAAGVRHADALRESIGMLRARLAAVATMLESAARPAQPGADLPRLAHVDASHRGDVTLDAALALLAEADALVSALQDDLLKP
jgi:uncharacterized membrane protein YccC